MHPFNKQREQSKTKQISLLTYLQPGNDYRFPVVMEPPDCIPVGSNKYTAEIT